MKLFTFKKGIHPEYHKEFTEKKAIEGISLPSLFYVPLQQHIGVPGQPLVAKGDSVKTGQIIGKSDALFSVPVHSPVTGTVKKIGPWLHPLGGRVEMIQIERTSDEDDWELLERPADWKKATPQEIIDVIRNAGIVGLGGATFPTHVKLLPPAGTQIDSFVLNGVECEPYLTADHRLMLEKADEMLLGLEILIHTLSPHSNGKKIKGYIGVEVNKMDAIEHLRARIKALGYDYEVIPLEVKYPQGAEKMLISAVLGRTVPAGKLPRDVGVNVNNTATALAVKEAVVDGKALIDRIVTVSGDSVNEPKNLNVRIGTPFQNLIDACGGLKDNVAEVYQGGPMMGASLYDFSPPVIKGTGGLICNSKVRGESESYSCIRCNSCIHACPVNLLPTRIARMSEKGMVEDAEAIGLLSCIECGSCSFVCPSHIPLVQWIRVGKVTLQGKKKREAAKSAS